MGKHHESIIGNPGERTESLHPGYTLFDIGNLLSKRVDRIITEFPVSVIVAVHADGESFRMRTKQGNKIRFAAIEVPRDEGDGCMKVCASAFRVASGIVEMTIRLGKPSIIDRQIRVMSI